MTKRQRDPNARRALVDMKNEVEFAEDSLLDLARYGSGAHEAFPLGTVAGMQRAKFAKMSRGDIMDLGEEL